MQNISCVGGLIRRIASRRSAGLAVAVLASALTAAAAGIPAVPIPQDPQADGKPYIGRPARPRPVRAFLSPQHPFMAPNGRSNIHNDPYQTDAYEIAGPIGRDPQVSSTLQFADCASVTFDSKGRVITICVGIEGPRLAMFDPDTLELLAELRLPPRTFTGGTGSSIFNDFSGGGYFYLDHEDRAVLATSTKEIWVVGAEDTPAGPAFNEVRIYGGLGIGIDEAIVSALPDWDGRIWFVTTRGLVGYVDPESSDIHTRRLEGELIGNSFAVAEDGVWVVSDHALYRFVAGRKGEPKVTWSRRYDRGSGIKPGMVTQGSGTTPTIVGEFVAIADNAEPRMNVLVYRRDREELVCEEPVFKAGKSATENTLIGVGRSLIVENNYGYTGPMATSDGASTAPGIARIDFDASTHRCRTVWMSDEISPTVVPKMSLPTGLVYVYTKPPTKDGDDLWYLTALDFRTGKTVYKVLTGAGLGYNNNYAPITLGPDGTAYVGALGGLIRVADGR